MTKEQEEWWDEEAESIVANHGFGMREFCIKLIKQSRLQGRREALESGIDYQRGRIAGLAEAMKLFKDHGNCYDPQSGHEFENALRIRIDGDPHVHVAGTKDECALCGKDLRDPIHLRSKLKESKNL